MLEYTYINVCNKGKRLPQGVDNMKIILEQRQTLKMVMTTELRQAIELLQLSNYELKQFIEKEAEENPFIELVEKEYVEPYTFLRKFTQNDDDEVNPFDFISKDEQSLDEHLLKQVNLLSITEYERAIMRFLVLNLNENGYLTMSNEEISEIFNVTEAEVERARQKLLTLDPIGVGARDLRECLLVQAKEKYHDDTILFSVIEDYLEDLANRKWNKIAENLQISCDQVANLFEKIRSLQPKPAINFSSKGVHYVTPDIIVDWNEEDDSFEVILNHYYIPNVRFKNEYVHQLPTSTELKSYVNEHYKKYNWLQQSIEQRRKTILNIMNVVLNRQRNFFKEGFRALKPLTLRDVADEIGMHESTVSRATANKIIQTPKGTFELRMLFSNMIKSEEGNDASQTKVKELLKEIVDNEDKAKPLSDQKIANILKEKHQIVISRRTVAKYRDELNIPSSTRRKMITL